MQSPTNGFSTDVTTTDPFRVAVTIRQGSALTSPTSATVDTVYSGATGDVTIKRVNTSCCGDKLPEFKSSARHRSSKRGQRRAGTVQRSPAIRCTMRKTSESRCTAQRAGGRAREQRTRAELQHTPTTPISR